jgi:hypothetical protein
MNGIQNKFKVLCEFFRKEQIPGEQIPGEQIPGEQIPGEQIPGEQIPIEWVAKNKFQRHSPTNFPKELNRKINTKTKNDASKYKE